MPLTDAAHLRRVFRWRGGKGEQRIVVTRTHTRLRVWLRRGIYHRIHLYGSSGWRSWASAVRVPGSPQCDMRDYRDNPRAQLPRCAEHSLIATYAQTICRCDAARVLVIARVRHGVCGWVDTVRRRLPRFGVELGCLICPYGNRSSFAAVLFAWTRAALRHCRCADRPVGRCVYLGEGALQHRQQNQRRSARPRRRAHGNRFARFLVAFVCGLTIDVERRFGTIRLP